MWTLVYEEPEGDNSDGSQETDDQQAKDEQANQEGKDKDKKQVTKTFNQEEVNRFLSEDRRKYQKGRDELIKQLQGLRENAQLTQSEKDSLEARIEQLQNESLTNQELAKKDKEKILKENEKREKALTTERDSWRDRYAREKIQRDLTDAAITYKAMNPIQIVNQLRPNTKLVEELKDGRPTGEWVAKVTFQDKDEKGEPLTLELTVTEAVKRMSEMSEHWNLFDSGARSGLGSFNQANGSSLGDKPPTDPAKFREWRKQKLGRGK